MSRTFAPSLSLVTLLSKAATQRCPQTCAAFAPARHHIRAAAAAYHRVVAMEPGKRQRGVPIPPSHAAHVCPGEGERATRQTRTHSLSRRGRNRLSYAEHVGSAPAEAATTAIAATAAAAASGPWGCVQGRSRISRLCVSHCAAGHQRQSFAAARRTLAWSLSVRTAPTFPPCASL